MISINAAQFPTPTSTIAVVRGSAGNSQISSQPTAPTTESALATVATAVVNLSVTATAATTTTREPASGKKDFATVAKDARASLDATYQKLGRDGDIYTDWRPIFQDMDRRSLYAVASNQGGQFNPLEQDMAKSAMGKQVEVAMGLDNPVNAANPTAGMSKAGITFLDGVSDEEKASFDWAKQRAATQFTYEVQSKQEGQEPENLDSDSPLVKLLKGGIDRLKQMDDPSQQLEDTPEYKRATQLSEQLKAANATSSSATGAHKLDITA